MRCRPVQLLHDVKLSHVSIIGISLVLVISLVLDVDLMEYKPSLPMIVSSLSLVVTISLVLVKIIFVKMRPVVLVRIIFIPCPGDIPHPYQLMGNC
jgi:hypothetical protein